MKLYIRSFDELILSILVIGLSENSYRMLWPLPLT